MSDDACAECGFPRAKHTYNGACYGVCGVFVRKREDRSERYRAALEALVNSTPAERVSKGLWTKARRELED